MSYVKKDFYGIPSVKIVDCTVGQGAQYVRQKGTNMIVDNLEVPGIQVNVKKLYQNLVMN